MRKPTTYDIRHTTKRGFTLRRCSGFTLRRCSGFTTTEILVGIGIFTVITTVMTGIFMSALKNQRLIQQIMTVNNNAGLVLEQITREIRTGYNFIVATGEGDCIDGGSELRFTNGQNNTTTTFSLATDNESIVRQEGDELALGLTALNVSVRQLCFVKIQYEGDKCTPERITVVMKVAPRGNVTSTKPFHIQTTVSSRVLPREIFGDTHDCRL